MSLSVRNDKEENPSIGIAAIPAIDQITNELKQLDKIDDSLCQEILRLIKMERDSRVQSKHKTASVLNSRTNKYYEIDVNIAELIHNIWRANISTTLSCEDNVPKNFIWICFPSDTDLCKFLHIVFMNTQINDPVFNRAFGKIGDYEDPWIYSTNQDFDFDDLDKVTDISLSNSLRFPVKDHDFVLQRLKDYNEKEQCD